MRHFAASNRCLIAAAATAGLLLLPHGASADIFSWTGGGADDNWNNPANWTKTSGASARLFPDDITDDALLANASSDAAQVIVVNGPYTISQINLTATGSRAYTIDSSGVGSGLTINDSAGNPGGIYSPSGGATQSLTINANLTTALTASTTDAADARNNLTIDWYGDPANLGSKPPLTLNGVITAGNLSPRRGGPILIGNDNNQIQNQSLANNGGLLVLATATPLQTNGTIRLELASGAASAILGVSVDASLTTLVSRDNNNDLVRYQNSNADRTLTVGRLTETAVTVGENQVTISNKNLYPGASAGGNLTLRITGDGAVQPDVAIESGSTLEFAGSGSAMQTLGSAVNLLGAGKVVVARTGTGAVDILSANTYAGGTFINDGTLQARADDALGTGNVTVAAGALLTIADPNIADAIIITDTIDDLATLSLFADSNTATGVNLVQASINEIVGTLLLDGVAQPAGTYGSTSSGATFTNDDYFAGAGIITVVPEPASGALLGIGAASVLRRRRRR